MRESWGTLSTSVKQINALYLFDWEQGIALHAKQGNWASSLGEGEVSLFISSCGYILEEGLGSPFKSFLCSVKSGLLSSYDEHLRNLNQAWQDNTDPPG